MLHEIDLTKLREKGLYYLSGERTADHRRVPQRRGADHPRRLGMAQPRASWPRACTPSAQAGIAGQPEQLQQSMAAAQVKLAQIAESLLTALSAPGAYKSPWPELSGSATPLMGLTSHRLILGNDRIGLVLLKLAQDDSQSFIQNAESIAALRRIIDRVKGRYPDVKIGLTGLPIMEHDEMQRSQSLDEPGHDPLLRGRVPRAGGRIRRRAPFADGDGLAAGRV